MYIEEKSMQRDYGTMLMNRSGFILDVMLELYEQRNEFIFYKVRS